MRPASASGRRVPRQEAHELIRFLAFLAALVAHLPHHHHHHHRPSWHRGQHFDVEATCYAQSGLTASGQETRAGIVANNFLRLGTRILLDRPVFGRRVYVVEDRIGWGSELDVFNSSESTCDWFGRERLGFYALR